MSEKIYYYHGRCVNCPAISELAYSDTEMQFIENCPACNAGGATIRRVRIVEA